MFLYILVKTFFPICDRDRERGRERQIDRQTVGEMGERERERERDLSLIHI